jgi:hypothetical protein
MVKDDLSKNAKVDLELVKKLVAELENSLTLAENIPTTTKEGMRNYIVEMQKSAGLAAGVMSEAALLVLDIKTLTTSIQGASPKSTAALDKFLGALKGGGFDGSN